MRSHIEASSSRRRDEEKPTQSSRQWAPWKTAAAAVLSVLFVVGVGVPAQAATATYANQQVSRNQTITSPSRSMIGGSVAISPGSAFEQTRATVMNVGSYNGIGNTTLNYTHSRTTTQVYCQWRNDNPPPFNSPSGLKLNITCKYTY